MVERTLAIIKPDAMRRRLAGAILSAMEESSFSLVALRLTRLTRAQAEAFYEVHRERPFYRSLCDYMSSGAVLVAALEGEQAISRWRELMGVTDPAKARAGTIRKRFGIDVQQNAVHGSDGPETAAREVAFFFSALDLLP
jgi:nucleoside-diphosphate kinase